MLIVYSIIYLFTYLIMNLRDYKTVKERKQALEKELGVSLPSIGSFSLDGGVASTRNCENMIGVAQVPLGIAGPLLVTKSRSDEVAKPRHLVTSTPRSYFVPLATTEGALVASVNRGCKALTAAGGVAVEIEHVGTTRGPVFRVSGIAEGKKLMDWVDAHVEKLDDIARSTSSHISLKHSITRMVGRSIYVRFAFDTQDAMGMNMVTIATTALAKHIEDATGATLVAVAGNFDIDKKPAWLSFHEGRGMRVWAEATISAPVVSEVLKTTPAQIFDVWMRKTMTGSMMAGSLGFNNHAANIIAALYVATGQDLAHVVEGSMATTMVEILDSGDLYTAVYLPAVLVGTVGGGTGLATQKEALSILGIAGGNEGKNAQTLAEIVGAAVLAGELSLLASLSTNTLACAHESLARGKKI